MATGNKRILYLILAGLILGAGILSCRNPLVSVIDEEVSLAITPPEVLAIFPAASDDDVPITLSTITVTFSKYIDEDSVNSDTFYVQNPAAAKLGGSRSVENEAITFTPTTNLAVGTVYTVIIDGVMDTDGNPISEKYTWSFTTGIEGDTSKPTISSVTINNGDEWTTSTTVTVNIDATDNFGIAQMNVSLINSFPDSNWTIFSDSFPLTFPEGEGVKNVFVKVKDGSGNVSIESVSDSIDMDTSIPSVADLLLNSGRSATRNSLVSIAVNGMDQENSSGVSEYQIRIAGDDWPADWSPLVDGVAFIDSYDLNVALGSVQTLEARVRDVAGNISEVALSSIIYEQTPPSVEEVSPYENQTNVPFNASVVEVLFNEEMDPASFTTENFYIEAGGSSLSGVFKFYDNGNIPYGKVQITGLSIGPNTDYLAYIKPTVRDAAGNEYGKITSWYFRSGNAEDTTAPVGDLAISGFQSAPIGTDNFYELPNGDWATNRNDLDLFVNADDDYNEVVLMSFWGQGDLPSTIDTAAQEIYNTSKFWTLGGTEKSYFLNYKLWDSVSNDSAWIHFNVIYDASAPTITSLDISTAELGNFGYLHTNNAEGTVEVVVSANDIGADGYQGSGLYQVRLSNDGIFPDITSDDEGEPGWNAADPDNWKDWSPIIPDWALGDTVEDLHTVYVDVRDYLGNYLVVPQEIAVILDTTPPSVSFAAADFKSANASKIQTGTFDDNVIAILSSLEEPVSASDLVYSWRQADQNAGIITFDDSAIMAPAVTADADGTYSLEVTVSDYAGNTTVAAVPFIWDQTPPADITSIISYDSEGNALSSSADTGAVKYTNRAEPAIEWPASAGADFYRIIFGSPDDAAPPVWEDYNWETTFPANYIESNVPYLTAPAPTFEGETDGAYRLYITAWDNAGNRSNEATDIHIDFGIDTLEPVITNSGQLISVYAQTEVDYSISTEPAGAENAIYDPVNPSDSSSGSGIASIDWAVVSGQGIVSVDETDTRKPKLSASADGMYELSVTVTDNASNQVTEPLFFEWDTTAPGIPSVSGINHTAVTLPEWTWLSGGDGNGIYQYRLEMDDGTDANYAEIKGWTLTDTESYTLEAAYENDLHRFILYVQERDRAGNWSAIASKKIWTESTFTAVPPPITLTGADYTRIKGESGSVTWTWTTGLSSGGGTYRYQLDSSDFSAWTATDDTTTSFSYSFATNGTNDGYHYMYVEEYDSVNTAWVDLVSSSYVLIDMTPPNVPALSVPPTNATTDATIDTTPTWSWSSGGGGMGHYRYSINSGSSWTEIDSNNVTLSLSNGDYIFWVQERDSAGNWSNSAVDAITIDVTAPTISSFGITTGTLTSSGNRYTASTSVTVSATIPLDAADEGQPRQIRFYNNGYTDWEALTATTKSKTFTVPTGEGLKYLYVQVKDYLGNTTGWYSDTIILDQTAPDVGTVSINGGATYTPSLNAYLSVSSSDNQALAEELDVQYIYYNGSAWVYSVWRPLSLGTTFSTYNTDNGSNYPSGVTYEDINFTPVAGSKLIYVRFKDPAGNTSSFSSYDTITLQIPEPTYATKGSLYSTSYNGYARVDYSTVTEDSGPNTTYYYAYWSSDPNADPNNGDTVTLLDGTTYAYNYVYNFGGGALRYFFIRAYNADTGGYGPYSTTSVLGFSSNVTVIYDDDVSSDVTRAQALKSLLEDKSGGIADQISAGYVSGTMPTYVVTLLPEDFISETYNGTAEVIGGDPIIITPQASYDLYVSASPYEKIHNIVANNHGVIAMGYYSGSFLSRVNSYFTTWGLSGTAPSEIIGSMTLDAATTAVTRPYVKAIDAEDVWLTPLAESYFMTNGTSTLTTSIFSASTGRRGVYLSTGLDPTDGAIYAGDASSSAHFPVVRQGRFLNFAYYEIPDTYTYNNLKLVVHRTGAVFFINLVARMDDF